MNYLAPQIQTLIKNRNWRGLPEQKRVVAIYNFVKDEINFGYNKSGVLPASSVLDDRYGYSHTKSILLMALLRAVNIPCRIHGFYSEKIVLKGFLTGHNYRRTPHRILHSWVEVYYKDEWLNLEGVILDRTYLTRLQYMFRDNKGSVCGWGAAIENFKNPPTEFKESHTYIQRDSIIEDLGVFDSPDEFFKQYEPSAYGYFTRRLMNKSIKKIRQMKM